MEMIFNKSLGFKHIYSCPVATYIYSNLLLICNLKFSTFSVVFYDSQVVEALRGKIISPTLVIDTSMERSSRVPTTPWKPTNLII